MGDYQVDSLLGGVAAPLMSVLLMITKAIVAPIPAFVVTAANGMVFGSFWGALISWITHQSKTGGHKY